MATVQLRFHQCIQDSQDFGSDDDRMVSRVFFTVVVDGTAVNEYSADVTQPVGASPEDGPLEVGRPSGYEGPLDYDAFRRCVEQYFRGLGGAGGAGRSAAGGHVRMRNNAIRMAGECSFEAEARSGRSW